MDMIDFMIKSQIRKYADVEVAVSRVKCIVYLLCDVIAYCMAKTILIDLPAVIICILVITYLRAEFWVSKK